MTINASIEFDKAKDKYDAAETQSEKLAALQEMRSTAPTHKASEKLRAEISGKIAKLKKEMEKQKIQAKKSSGHSINIKKEGDGQITILGLPNSGKSYLLKELTGVDVEIAPYPFTTSKPEVGMLDYKGAKIQLVEVPAIIKDASKGKANGTKLLSLARNSDATIITYANEEEKEIVVKELKNSGIVVNRKKPEISIKHSQYKGITISGKQFLKMSLKEFSSVLKSLGIHSASVLLKEDTTLEKLSEVLDDTIEYRNCLFLKKGEYHEKEKLKEDIFLLLEKIIIYTKRPGHDPDYKDPLVLKNGSTITEVAEVVHKDIAKHLKYARVWGSSKFEGQRVSKDYKLKTEDVVEIS
ncbi:MAG: TGS domain-containing protein [archaeon]|nr:TGS domain-containing protein [archaeon]